MNKKATQASSISTTTGGGLAGKVWPDCALVGRTVPHIINSCYFNPKKMTDRREWARKLMDKNGGAYNDDNWRQGKSKTVVHRNSIKGHLLYEASLRYSTPPSYIATPPTNTTAAARKFLLQRDTGTVDSGAIHFYIASSSPHGPPNTSASKISVGTATRHVERS